MPGGAGGQGRPRGDGKPIGPDRPLEKGVRGIETSGSGYLRQQIRGGRKGRAERQGLAQLHNIAKKHRPKDYQGIIRCQAGAGGQGKPIGDRKPAGPDRTLGKGMSSEEVRLDDPRI